MTDKFEALEMLLSLDNFSDPVGPAARLQTERLMKEIKRFAMDNPDITYRLNEEGPEQTLSEIIAQWDADEDAINGLRGSTE